MKALAEIILALVFLYATGIMTIGVFVKIRGEALTKIHHGLSPLSSFTQELTSKKN